LQEYNFEIIYKSEKRHQDADALSRNPIQPANSVAVLIQPRTPQDLQTLQLNDPFTGPIIRRLENDSSSVNSTNRFERLYELQNGILYRRTAPYPSLSRFVVPSSLRTTFLDLEHKDPSSGHLGFAKTFDRLHRKYFWPRMRRDTIRYVRSCETCQSHKGSTHPSIDFTR